MSVWAFEFPQIKKLKEKSFQLLQDYGTLLCSGSNEMGMQTEPCVFHIIPAGK